MKTTHSKCFKQLFFALLTLCACGFAATGSAMPYDFVVKHDVGGAKFFILADSIAPRNMSIFKDVDPELLKKYYPDGTYTGTVTACVFKTAKFNILIDTGYGPKEGSPGGKLFERLGTTGLKTTDIDVVLLTHTHGDHVGGLLSDGKAAFPNATIFLSSKEDPFWQTSQPAQREAVYAAYGGRVVLFESGKDIIAGVKSIAAFGHTPGHTAFLLNDKVLVAGDFLHATKLQLAEPEVCPIYDRDKEQSVASRRMLLDMAADKGYLITGMHMTFPTLGTVNKSGLGYVVANTYP